MKGLVLSGGTGSRLRPITHTNAKQLVPIGNKPILFYGLEALREAGISEVGIVVGHTKDEIVDAVGRGDRFDLSVTYIEQEAPLGLAHAVLVSEEFLGKEDFVMYLGDNLIKGGVCRFVEAFMSSECNAQILLSRVRNPERFGVAVVNDGRVERLVEKPQEHISDLALAGVYLFDQTIFTAAANIEPSARGELEITDAIQFLLDHGYSVHAHTVEGWWKDTGRLEDLLEANRLILEDIESRIEGDVDARSQIFGSAVIEEGAEIIDSIVRGPAVIGRGSRIAYSFVGPFTSISRDCTLINCEIEHSIVLAESSIQDVSRIEDSLIGREVTIRRRKKRPHVFRLVLGDHSSISVL